MVLEKRTIYLQVSGLSVCFLGRANRGQLGCHLSQETVCVIWLILVKGQGCFRRGEQKTS